MTYSSGWMDLGQDAGAYIKILKTINGSMYSGVAGNTFRLVWGFDFDDLTHSYTVDMDDIGGGGEWGIGEWGIMEWGGGGAALQRFNIPASGSGQYIKLGIVVPIDERTFSIQQLNLYAKIGRLAN
jgi:hypothetical protein